MAKDLGNSRNAVVIATRQFPCVTDEIKWERNTMMCFYGKMLEGEVWCEQVIVLWEYQGVPMLVFRVPTVCVYLYSLRSTSAIVNVVSKTLYYNLALTL